MRQNGKSRQAGLFEKFARNGLLRWLAGFDSPLGNLEAGLVVTSETQKLMST